ncbi:MAG: DUF4832 domain-containing protein [Eubacterium sp.]|nr:DUF4832 domain-containing protein [Eubacterium sp.]
MSRAHRKKNRKYILLFLIFLAAALLTGGLIMHNVTVSFQPAAFQETDAVLQNPYAGFYQLLGYTPSEAESDTELQNWISANIDDDATSLLLLEINLKEYASTSLSTRALSQIDALFTAASSSHLCLIVRFLYDWNGEPLLTEPADISTVRKHISQLSEVVNRHSDTIYILQGCLVGAYGEMHDGRFSSPDDQESLIRLLNEKIDPSIYLAVRTPAMQRAFTGSSLSVTDKNAFDGTLESRLSLFNDGMLGSLTDLGTYAETSSGAASNSQSVLSASDSSYARARSRAEELAFQERLCSYVPNGGEAVLVNPFSSYPACIHDLSKMHVSYLNSEHDPDLISYWKSETCSSADDILSSDLFNGSTVYDYIGAHLGYRYLITGADARRTGLLSPALRLDVTLQNNGFSPACRRFQTSLLLWNWEDKKIKTYDLSSFDNRTLLGNGSQMQLVFNLPAEDLDKGTWDAMLTMTDPALGCTITLADKKAQVPAAASAAADEHAVYLGSLTIS